MSRSFPHTAHQGLDASGTLELQLDSVDHTPRTLLDRLGAVLGFLCAVHCLAVPLLLGALPALGLGFLADHSFDMAIIGLASVVAFFAARSGLRAHGDARIVVGFVAAVTLLVVGHILGEDGLVGRIPSIVGGFSLFALHLYNLRLSRRACCRFDLTRPGTASTGA